jgi:hypothetical protein
LDSDPSIFHDNGVAGCRCTAGLPDGNNGPVTEGRDSEKVRSAWGISQTPTRTVPVFCKAADSPNVIGGDGRNSVESAADVVR